MLLCQCLFMCGRHLIFYVCFVCYYFARHWKTWCKRARESERRYQRPIADTIQQQQQKEEGKKRKLKQEPLVMARLLLPNSNLLLPSTVYIWLWWARLEVGKPNNILANNRQANGHSHEGQKKATCWTTRQTRGRTTQRRIGSWSTCCTR